MTEPLTFLITPEGEVESLDRPAAAPWNETAIDDMDLLAAIGLDLDGRRMLAKAVVAAGHLNSVRWPWVRGKGSHAPLELTAWCKERDGTPGIEVHVATGRPGHAERTTIPSDLANMDFQQAAVEAADRAGLGLAVLRNHHDHWQLDWINAGGARLLGRPRETLLGGNPAPIDPSTQSRTWNMEEDSQIVVPWQRPDGRTVQLSVGVADGRIRGDQCVVLFFRDVTESFEAKRRADAALRELEKTNHDLSMYSAAIGHDLRTPLRNLMLALDVLERQDLDLPPEVARLMDSTSRQVRRMDGMLVGLLECTRTRAIDDPAAVDLGALATSVVEELGEAIKEAGAAVSIEALPTILGDARLLERVFSNLLLNALKYRGQGDCQIRISGARDDDIACVGIHDNGIGFDPSQRQSIFQLFNRGDRSGDSGHGVGLALCKRIVEVHGGRIWADSTPGKGSTFWFTLPRIVGES